MIIVIISSTGTYFSNAKPKYKAKTIYEVVRVLDGDTFEVKGKTETITVRMMGIDTPETIDPRKTVQCFGKEASNKTKELLMGKKVRLETEGLDKFHRTLAYVYLEDGLLVNKYLIENGYAHEYTYNIPYEKQIEFKKAESIANRENKGLWGDVCIFKTML